ncbi:hypothetical protein DB88DRAFT_488109 [Papiliotrema laurentii]|uniref:Oligosaccharyltransferase complex subunit gamma n=1 Tax=Papiliotrema laurentii TaxID=5418 RepID=A0AAD9FS17_PAPLA|nr:hypothetical protein DB88DRAFT_488109 [Papiliotrema laurentii]
MRFTTLLLPLLSLPLLAIASSAEHWATLASKSKDGVIKLDSQSYDDLLSADRDYSVSVVLTALPAQFKCQPCHDFEPNFRAVASSWRRMPEDVRKQHFFASLDFPDGGAIYQRLGLQTAPTLQFHPALSGPNKSNKLSVVTYDLNRKGLAAPPFHEWISNLTPKPFELHKPFNPVPFIVIPLVLVTLAGLTYALWPYALPLIQSRLVWGVASILLILTFTSGHMWNRIKNAPYVAVSQNGQTSWIAGGFQQQLGLESQVVGAIYGLLSFSIIALTVFVPAQLNPAKQRIAVYLWLAMLVVVFSLLFKLFKVKNGGYPFSLLF